jgi:carbonic anhydrase/acetyltransferase-like protein (isoleucine patch superfamily)
MTNKYILPYNNIYPTIDPSCFIAPNSTIIGDVTIGPKSGVWFNSCIRGDVAKITIGERSNIQEGTVIHVSRDNGPTFIGSRVTIGHQCLLHACTIFDDAFIGMGSIILDKGVVESHAMLAAGSLLTGSKVVKTGELWAGRPAKYMRALTKAEIDYIATSEANYSKHAEEYLAII